MCDVTLRRVRFKHFCRGKAINIKYYAFVRVSFVTQHANCMHGIILSSVACLALPCFSMLSHTRLDYGKKKVIEHKMRILILSTIFV